MSQYLKFTYKIQKIISTRAHKLNEYNKNMPPTLYKQKILQALEQSDTLALLENLVFEMSKAGIAKQAIIDLFNQIHQEENDDKTDPLLEILDRLCGWCPKETILLPDEEPLD